MRKVVLIHSSPSGFSREIGLDISHHIHNLTSTNSVSKEREEIFVVGYLQQNKKKGESRG